MDVIRWIRDRMRAASLALWLSLRLSESDGDTRYTPGIDRTAFAPDGEAPGTGLKFEVHATDPDADLLCAVFNEFPHSTTAYSELVRKHWNTVYAACQAILLHERDAEDATQDAFLKAHRYLPSYRFESRFPTWLRRIAKNTALNLYRERRTERLARDRVAADPSLRGWWLPWRKPQPTDQRDSLRRALETLSPEDRTLSDLWGEPARSCHDPILSGNGASGNPGAVHMVPEAQVEVVGHTDNVGRSGANRTLSQERARSVAEALMLRGVSQTQLAVIGRGDTMPIASNATVAGRQANRRVEFIRTH